MRSGRSPDFTGDSPGDEPDINGFTIQIACQPFDLPQLAVFTNFTLQSELTFSRNGTMPCQFDKIRLPNIGFFCEVNKIRPGGRQTVWPPTPLARRRRSHKKRGNDQPITAPGPDNKVPVAVLLITIWVWGASRPPKPRHYLWQTAQLSTRVGSRYSAWLLPPYMLPPILLKWALRDKSAPSSTPS